MMLGIAFKEWAVICEGLAAGRQALILRKGGIAESGGEFRPEHARFWLYPTYLHEHRAAVKPTAQSLFDAAEAARPPRGTVRLSHYAEVAAVHRAIDWPQAAALEDLHVWTESAVRTKFDYRSPGLYVLPVRVFRVVQPVELTETPAYAGCKTWVELERELPVEGAAPVIDERKFAAIAAYIGIPINASLLGATILHRSPIASSGSPCPTGRTS